MELLYVYVEKYAEILEKQGFRFSTKFIVDYDEELRVIQINKNQRQIDNFYGEAISNITAIVGKNGTGKTTVLDLIGLDSKTRVETSEYYYDDQYLYRDKYYMVYHVDKDVFYIEGLGNVEIKNISNLNESILSNTSKEGMKKQEFYSFFFQVKGENSFEIIEAGERLYLDDKRLSKIIYINDIFGSRRKEQVQYLNTGNDKLIKRNHVDTVDLIEWYRVFIDFSKSGHIKSESIKILFKKYGYREKYKSLIRIPPKIEEATSFLDSQSIITIEIVEDFFRYFQINILDNIIKICDPTYEATIGLNKLNDLIEDLADDDINEFHKDIFELFRKNILDIMFNDDHDHHKKKVIIYYDILVELFFAMIDIKEFIVPSVDSFEVIITNNENPKILKFMEKSNEVKNFIENIKELKYFHNPFHVENIRMSKGEEKLITLFSKINKEIVDYIAECEYYNLRYKKDVIFLIDEIDECMHPEWSRNLVNIIVNLLDKKETVLNSFNISQIIKVQFIISTHSPFLLSDLSSDNIISLYPNGDKVLEDKKKKKNNTFGQNIHTILNDNFFMDASIGEFSRNKINEVIQLLNPSKDIQGKYREKNKKRIKSIINIIGEPVLKNKLEQMYYIEFPEDYDRIESLKKEKEILEKVLKKSGVENHNNILESLQSLINELEKKK